MITKSATAVLNSVDIATINDRGVAVVMIDGREHFMSAGELKDMWAKLGVLIREFNKWNG